MTPTEDSNNPDHEYLESKQCYVFNGYTSREVRTYSHNDKTKFEAQNWLAGGFLAGCVIREPLTH